MFNALTSSQPVLRKRAVQTVTKFLHLDDACSSLLTFVKERFDQVLGSTDPETPNNQRISISYFKIALQCLVALAYVLLQSFIFRDSVPIRLTLMTYYMMIIFARF